MDLAAARRRISELKHLNAFISLTEEEGSGSVVAVKDLVDVRGTVTTAGGIILPAEPAREDAPVIQTMRKHGCVVVGKANLHEWAFGVTSANPHYGHVRNPHDHNRVAGGSSGGSAVAVATGMCDWAVGSDTGGSIRIPAGLCGVVGFKPTLGTIGLEGVIPLSSSLDTLGPLAPDVRTAARALEMMSGLRDLVPEEIPAPTDLRLAVPRGWVDELDEPTGRAWRQVSEGLPEVDFPERRRVASAALTVLFAEAAAYHRERVERFPDRYGSDVLEHLRRGLTISAAEYINALSECLKVRQEADDAMSGVDAVLMPATACVAPLIGQDQVRDPLSRFTRPFNGTGQPVICLPAPVSGLPVGIQVVGRAGQERRLVEVALALEQRWSQAV